MIVDVGLARDALRGITVAALPVVHLPPVSIPRAMALVLFDSGKTWRTAPAGIRTLVITVRG